MQCLDFKKAVCILKIFQERPTKMIPETVPDTLSLTHSIYFRLCRQIIRAGAHLHRMGED